LPFPPKLTLQVRMKIIGMLMEGATIEKCARRFKVSSRAIRKLRAKDPTYAKEWENAKDKIDDLVEASLAKQAILGNVKAGIYWMNNRRPAKWRSRREVTIDPASEIRIVREDGDD